MRRLEESLDKRFEMLLQEAKEDHKEAFKSFCWLCFFTFIIGAIAMELMIIAYLIFSL
jgi:hypothetical protein